MLQLKRFNSKQFDCYIQRQYNLLCRKLIDFIGLLNLLTDIQMPTYFNQSFNISQKSEMANRLTQISKGLGTQIQTQSQSPKTSKKTLVVAQPQSMRRQHINEVAELFTKNFLNANAIWKSFDLDRQQVYKFFVNEIKLHLDSQQKLRKEVNPNIAFNMVCSHEGKVIGAGLNFELHQYLKVSNSPAQSQTLKHFQVLQGYGKKLFEPLKISQHQPGKHVYGSFIVLDEDVDPEIKKAYRKKALVYTYKNLIDQGFKTLILRTSNVKSEQIYLGLGAKILSEVQFELKGSKFELKLLKLELENPIFKKMIGL